MTGDPTTTAAAPLQPCACFAYDAESDEPRTPTTPDCRATPMPEPTETAAGPGPYNIGGVSLHEPSLARRDDGAWGVFCTACSTYADDYVYPCKAFPNDPEWPPAVLVEATDGK